MYSSLFWDRNDGFSQSIVRDAEASNMSPVHLSQGFHGDADVSSSRRKSIYDRIYGPVLFPPVFNIFLDSPQVQRLRGLRQMGNAQYIFPGATNTRFEHSVGTAHMAMELLKQIYANHQEERDYIIASPNATVQPPCDPVVQMLANEYDSAVKDLWCVGIAGLCHDLGHGPLSHMFETYVNKVRRAENRPEWHHEMASLKMVDAIWDANQDELETRYSLNDQDRAFVKLCIDGIKPSLPWDEEKYGRPAWKRFMTEIVANKRNGLDVDKLDYVQRDHMSCCGMPLLPALSRLFQGARALPDKTGQYQIAYQEKLDGTIDSVFNARAHLHRIIYQHRVTCVMDHMSVDAFMAADKHFFLHDDTGRAYRLSDCVDYPDVYIKTGDWVVKAMLNTPTPAMRRCREILERIEKRQIYTSVLTYNAPRDTKEITTASNLGTKMTGSWQGHTTTTMGSPERVSRACTPRRGSSAAAIRQSQNVAADNANSNDEEARADTLENREVSTMSEDLITTPVSCTPIQKRLQRCSSVSEDEVNNYLLHSQPLSASLCERMSKWTQQNDNLHAVLLIKISISKVAGDMDQSEEPLKRVGFFHHRDIGVHPPGSSLCRCWRLSRDFAPHKPDVRYVVVSRMPLETGEKDELSAAVTCVLTDDQKHTTQCFAATPTRERFDDARVTQQRLSRGAPQLDGIVSPTGRNRATHSQGSQGARREISLQMPPRSEGTAAEVVDADAEAEIAQQVVVVDDDPVDRMVAEVRAEAQLGVKRARSRTPPAQRTSSNGVRR